MRSVRLALMLPLLTGSVVAPAQVAAPRKADATICELTGDCGEETATAPKKPEASKPFKLGDVKRVETARPPQMPQAPNPNRRKAVATRQIEFALAFAPGSSELAAGELRVLDQVAKSFNAPTLSARRFLVEGHSGVAPGTDVVTLSGRRAEAVRLALIERGVAPQRLETRAYGASRPLPDVASADPRNDRVELRLVV